MRILKLIYKGWMKVAHTIGKINTLILLTFFYLTILAVARLIVWLLRKDPLDLQWADKESYWRTREELSIARTDFLKPY